MLAYSLHRDRGNHDIWRVFHLSAEHYTYGLYTEKRSSLGGSGRYNPLQELTRGLTRFEYDSAIKNTAIESCGRSHRRRNGAGRLRSSGTNGRHGRDAFQGSSHPDQDESLLDQIFPFMLFGAVAG